VLPSNYNEAYHLAGDGVAVPGPVSRDAHPQAYPRPFGFGSSGG
jgi:hypothetical protein